ncbi:hypothetical protein RND71_003307 [Anisodus tanguticus]|uniref:C2 NT-type domain-containing protein n=1 Tax=Anisodus tanguticus TaxID=243964 RepID=A0AAE1SWE8_9SOLA|nr:hypothetical protein RND71_003307 [Anisodus tanguticus]
MVLGLRSKHKKGASIQVEYVVQVDEIKPWPPSQSLKSVQSVLLQWENDGQSSGSIVSTVGDSSIEFRESFTLPLTLCREKKVHDKFQKNFLDFYLYELRKDKTTRGQLLGTSVINLADFGLIEEVVSIYTPLNCKKSSKGSEQPALFVNIHPTERGSSSSSQISVGKEQESNADSVNGKYEDDYEISSFTDDESSHSSQNVARSSPSQQGKIAHESIIENLLRDDPEPDLLLGLDSAAMHMDSTSRSSIARNVAPGLSGSLSLNRENSGSNTTASSKFSDRSMTSIQKKTASQVTGSASSLQSYGNKNGKATFLEQQSLMYDVQEDNADTKGLPKDGIKLSAENGRVHRFTSNISYLDASIEDNSDTDSYNDRRQDSRDKSKGHAGSTVLTDLHVGVVNGKGMELLEIDQDEDNLKEIPHFSEIKLGRKHKGDTLNSNKVQGSSITNGKSKHVKSHDLANRSGQNPEKTVKLHVSEDARSNGKGNKPMINGSPDRKNEWKSRIETLEEELREAAAVEVSLYSVVAEHGGSAHKVHAPARRLSRFYVHACTAKSRAKQAGAAKAAVSGLVLVSKACGNDVPRLTFWLSNSVMLRAIVSQAAGGRKEDDRPYAASNTSKTSLNARSLKKRNGVSFNTDHNSITEELGDWDDIETFMLALEQVEAWIFSRIVESVWWQTLTPHMQNTVANSGGRSMSSNVKKTYGRRSSLGDQEQGNFSIELWKKAFKDACERLCPVRAGGHECGCLPLLARLVMEQLVSRLDVAMFNAILRESAEEMPTDPVSDPICDSKVLPIPAGKSSFGAGAQLKNAIGDWSRWLSTLFGIEENDSSGDNEDLLHDKAPGPAKPFHLLNALSSLMMLPFEMLADPQTRKEVCPILGPTLIMRVLNGFVPDEFCPIPVPPEVLRALDSEDDLDIPEESVSTVPFTASPTTYLPPPVRSIKTFLGETGNQSLQRSGSSVLKKSYTSDDELDELESPLTSIVADRFRSSPNLAKINLIAKGKGDWKVVRYQLLRQVWRAEEH